MMADRDLGAVSSRRFVEKINNAIAKKVIGRKENSSKNCILGLRLQEIFIRVRIL
jgi:hypothetical protein